MVTWLEDTPAEAATEDEMAASLSVVKASSGSAATKPIATWYVVTATDPGRNGGGSDGDGEGVVYGRRGEGGGEGDGGGGGGEGVM